MTTIHKIKLKDLNADYIQKLKSEQSDGNQDVTIWIQGSTNMMDDPEFWKIIALIDWTKDNHSEMIQPSVDFLAGLSIEKIKAFENTLSKKLYQLDGLKYAQSTGLNAYENDEKPFSADVFLYARCAVVAKGEEVFEKVLHQPELMLKDQTFERLLNLASLAYHQKTGKYFDHFPAYIYETFSNANGWGTDTGLLENILNIG